MGTEGMNIMTTLVDITRNVLTIILTTLRWVLRNVFQQVRQNDRKNDKNSKSKLKKMKRREDNDKKTLNAGKKKKDKRKIRDDESTAEESSNSDNYEEEDQAKESEEGDNSSASSGEESDKSEMKKNNRNKRGNNNRNDNRTKGRGGRGTRGGRTNRSARSGNRNNAKEKNFESRENRNTKFNDGSKRYDIILNSSESKIKLLKFITSFVGKSMTIEIITGYFNGAEMSSIHCEMKMFTSQDTHEGKIWAFELRSANEENDENRILCTVSHIAQKWQNVNWYNYNFGICTSLKVDRKIKANFIENAQIAVICPMGEGKAVCINTKIYKIVSDLDNNQVAIIYNMPHDKYNHSGAIVTLNLEDEQPDITKLAIGYAYITINEQVFGVAICFAVNNISSIKIIKSEE